MANASFPGLLRARARLLGSLTRSNLALMGVTYLLLSLLHISGMISLVVIVCVLLVVKQLERVLPAGFWRLGRSAKSLPYAYGLEALWRR